MSAFDWLLILLLLLGLAVAAFAGIRRRRHDNGVFATRAKPGASS